MTVKDLYEQLEELVKDGQGDKRVIVADDEEANGFHELYSGVCADKDVISFILADGLVRFCERATEDDIVLLG